MVSKAERSQLRGWAIDRAIETIKACGIKDANADTILEISTKYAEAFIKDMAEADEEVATDGE